MKSALLCPRDRWFKHYPVSMSLLWLWVAGACMLASAGVRAERGGGGASLRGALEALQRRQRGRTHGPLAPPPDYEALYEYLPQPYSEVDYPDVVDDFEGEPPSKYIVKLLDQKERPSNSYAYKIVKKKNSRQKGPKESPFRERSHHADNDRLRDLFSNDAENEKEISQDRAAKDAEYAVLLGQLWSKYKNTKNHNSVESAPQGVVKLYKEKYIQKRYADNWGPIAYKRKRSSGPEPDQPVLPDYAGRKSQSEASNYNAYDTSDDDKDDLREEYAIAFQPLDDDSFPQSSNDDKYVYETIEKRSSEPYISSNYQKKRNAHDKGSRDSSRRFRSSSGTDPRIIKDLSKLFGDSGDVIRNPVKRSSDGDEKLHETYKPPQVAVLSHNNTHDHHNSTGVEENSHEQHGHLHHPGMLANEADHIPEKLSETEKPINIRKKSIDWSEYFGIDKRKKKSVSFVNNLSEPIAVSFVNDGEALKKQYFDTFNKEVMYPLNQFRKHDNANPNYVERSTPNEDTEIQIDNAHIVEVRTDQKRDDSQENETKLDNIDEKLRNMEEAIVDEAMHYSNDGEELDSKEEQEMKEKLLSQLAAAYSLEKMRKALKEFKQSMQVQKNLPSSPVPTDSIAKRVAVKKELTVSEHDNEIPRFHKEEDKNDDFEGEQGAGHYLNGKIDEQFSEGYMGSGRNRVPAIPTTTAAGSCPVLSKIVQRCRGVDLLSGDRGQLFLPLCSLHQICYLCGEAPPTTCDLVFLSEADKACEGDTGCQRAARSALMTLRELHDSLADELDGECEASPCLPATLKLNVTWQRALQR